jgi:hypothetical protein
MEAIGFFSKIKVVVAVQPSANRRLAGSKRSAGADFV